MPSLHTISIAALALLALPAHAQQHILPDVPMDLVDDPYDNIYIASNPQLLAADFNGDGNVDFAWHSVNSLFNLQIITVVLGDGTGRFTEPEGPSIRFDQASNLETGDFNNDGFDDLAYGYNEIKIRLSNGDGSFQDPILVPGNYWRGPADKRFGVHDFDLDGKDDIVYGSKIILSRLPFTPNFQTNDITEYSPWDEYPPRAESTKRRYQFIDLDGNGIVEVLGDSVNPTASHHTPLLFHDMEEENHAVVYGAGALRVDYDGDGNHDQIDTALDRTDPLNPVFTITADPINQDDFPHQLTRVDGSQGWLGDFVTPGNGRTWQFEPTIPYSFYENNGIEVIDLDQDGHLDFVGIETIFRPTNITSYRTPTPGFRFYSEGGSDGPHNLAIDVNNDSVPDIIRPGFVFLARRSPLKPTPIYQLGSSDFEPMYAMAVADIDNDGVEDLISPWITELRIAQGTHQHDPDTGLAIGNTTTQDLTTWKLTADIQEIQLNGDAFTDFVAATFDGFLVLYTNSADGSFTTTLIDLNEAEPSTVNIALADLDHDGDDDVVATVARQSGSDFIEPVLLTLENDLGTLTIRQRTLFAQPGFPDAILATDRDNDGNIDFIITDEKTPQLVTAEQIADFSFAFTDPIPMQTPTFEIFETDLDANGITEILVTTMPDSPTPGSVVAFFRDAQGHLSNTPTELFTIGNNFAYRIITHDANADGTTEIVITGSRPGSFYAGFLQIFTQSPQGAWTNATNYPASQDYRCLDLLDLDHDGDLDIVYGGTSGLRVAELGFRPYGPCRADINADGFIDIGDIADFIDAYLQTSPTVDMNRDTFIDFGDISEFVTRFLDGC